MKISLRNLNFVVSHAKCYFIADVHVRLGLSKAIVYVWIDIYLIARFAEWNLPCVKRALLGSAININMQ